MPGMLLDVVEVMVLALVKEMMEGMEWQKEDRKGKRTVERVEESEVTVVMP